MWELDHKEGWVPENWCFQIVVLEKTLESPLDCKEIKPVNPKGNQSWIFIGRIDAEAEAPKLPIKLWAPDGKSQLIGKDPGPRKDWRQLEKGKTGWKLWEIVKDREAWHALVHQVAKSWTRLSNCKTNKPKNIIRSKTALQLKTKSSRLLKFQLHCWWVICPQASPYVCLNCKMEMLIIIAAF